MIKIFRYELKRLILNKFFFALLIITGLYGYKLLTGDIIAGIAYTAPFSAWSYGAYLAGMLPLLLIALLFFMTFMYSNQERKVKQLTFAAPVNRAKYGLIKCSAMAVACMIISLFVIVISIVFYALIFRFYSYGDFVIPIIITLLPSLLFTFGIGLMAGGVQSNILYALMIALLLFGFLPLPAFIDLYGGNLFYTHPLSLPVGLDGEPAFTLPVSFVMGKVLFSVTGTLMIFFGIKKYAVKSE